MCVFLRCCRKYLADENIDVRVATENVLADFLREIREIAKVKKQQDLERVLQQPPEIGRKSKRSESKPSLSNEAGKPAGLESLWKEEDHANGEGDGLHCEEWEGKGSGSWIPGQGVLVRYEEIVDILLRHVSYPSKFKPWLLPPSTN